MLKYMEYRVRRPILSPIVCHSVAANPIWWCPLWLDSLQLRSNHFAPTSYRSEPIHFSPVGPVLINFIKAIYIIPRAGLWRTKFLSWELWMYTGFGSGL